MAAPQTPLPRSRGDAHPLPSRDLGHLPGHDGLPFFGNTFEYFADPEAYSRVQNARYGDIWRSNVLFSPSAIVQSADAAELILMDRERNFSSELGWWPTIGAFFGGGLMLRDFEEHRLHRKRMQSTFKRAAIERYVEQTRPSVTRALTAWPTGSVMRFYPRIKALLLEQAATVFLGVPLGDDATRVQRAFTDIVYGPVARVPFALPGTGRWRAHRSRAFLADFLRSNIPARRAREGDDMFTRLCREAADDEGRFTDDEIVDHMVFLLMAAHDTTTSALTTLVEALAQDTAWQSRLRDEALASTDDAPDDAAQSLAERCLREALRLYPPVPTVPRRALRDCELAGATLKANSTVWIDTFYIQRSAAYFTDPDRFDPERFSDARAEHKRHRFCWFPFGGGAHTCIGMHFAIAQSVAFIRALSRRFKWRLARDAAPKRQLVPFPKPTDDLPLIFEALT